MFAKEEKVSPSGLVAQVVSSSGYKSEQFKLYSAQNFFTSPIEAILCLDTFQSLYTQLLCGLLMCRHVTRIGAGMASGLLCVVRFLELNWANLCHDIEVGTLNPIVTDPDIRAHMALILTPDRALAEAISKECQDGNWEGIILRIWPNTKYLDVIITGAMAQYIPMLDYYSKGLPKVSTIYASSECFFGINMKPFCDPYEVSYTIMPNMAYFEFIEQSDGRDLGKPIELANVEIGKDYEIIVTNYVGLWRYRIGDILRVTGFHNSAPNFHLLRRKNVILSIDMDKTDEKELYVAVRKASALLEEECEAGVVECTSRAETREIPGHYVLYFELLLRDPSRPPSFEVEKCCLKVEESLNAVYWQYRASGSVIGPLQIRVVKEGTFEEIMDYAISRRVSMSQYKVPKCVSDEAMMRLLDERVVSVHFSPAVPKWSPECRD